MTRLILRLLTSRAAGPMALVAAAALAGLLVVSRLEVGSLERRIAAHDLAEKAAASAAAEARARQEAKTREIEAAAVIKIRQVRQAAKTLAEEVHEHVSAQADDRCTVPVGFVRLHDAAAKGLSAVAATGLADDAASGIALSAVGETLVSNYGIARENTEQLRALQAWVAEAASASQ